MRNLRLSGKGIFAIAVGLVLAVLFLTLAYFIGLFALIIGLFWVVWGFLVSLFLMVWAWLSALFAGTWLVGLVGTLVTWFNLLMAWFASTWLGSIFVPIYNLLLPIVLKIAPFFSIGNGSAKLMKWFKKFRARGEKNLNSAVKGIQAQEEKPKKTPKK